MKKLLFLFLFLPLLASAQLDFESNKGKLNFVSLPEVENIFDSPLQGNDYFVKKYSRKLPSFKLSKENYRQPVSMSEAFAASQTYAESNLKPTINVKALGISGGNSNYSSDSSTKVKNAVYKDASSGFYFHGCPPFGVCPRCAPYRLGRSYY